MSENAKFLSGIIPGRRLFRAAALAALYAFSSPAMAQQADPNAQALPNQTQPLGAAEQKILLDEIERYFSTVDTMRARFLQYNMDGTLFRGQVFMSRPGKMRIEYDPPIPYKIVADGSFYIFIDEELEEASHIPLALTPANILLRQPLNLEEDLIVKDAARSDRTLFITVAQKDARDAGTLTLAFSEDPLALRQWTVIDAQGTITRVVLENPQIGVELNEELFSFINPWTTREGGN